MNQKGREGRTVAAGPDDVRFRRIEEAAAAGLVVANEEGSILFVNSAAEKLLGYSTDELLGEPVAVLVPERMRETHAAALRRHLTSGLRQVPSMGHRLIALHRDGTEIECEIDLRELSDSSERLLAAVLRRSAGRVGVGAMWAAQHRVADVLSSTDDLHAGAAQILEAICTMLGWQVGILWTPGPLNTLGAVEVWCGGVPDVESMTTGLRENQLDVGTGLSGMVWQSRRATWGPLERSGPGPMLAGQGLKYSLAFPLIEEGEPIAVMQFVGASAVEVDDNLLLMTGSIAALISQCDESKRLEARLRESESQLRLALASAETGIWELDLTTNDEIWSDGLFRLYGLDPRTHSASYGLWLSILHPDDRKPLDGKTKAVPETSDDSFHDEFRIIHPRHGVRWMLSRGQVRRDENGRAVAMQGTIVDITDRKRAEEEITTLNRELESRVRARTRELAASNAELEAFAYSVSHDLRAPLRGIDGFSKALLEDYGPLLDERAHEYLSRVRSGARRLGTLIDDLLFLSQLSRQEPRSARTDLSGLAREITSRLTGAEPGRQVEVAVQPGVTCEGDSRLLRVVLENLLGNALKFTGRTAEARVEFGSIELNETVVYYVRDNGIGFDPRYADKLFEPFQRLHTRDHFEGSGIGLATVKRIVERHGGRVWADGSVGGGATFYFSLHERSD
jgi:PAS domain S-box-containing protein